MTSEVQITEADLSSMLQQKVNAVTNLEIQTTVLQRVIVGRDTRIAELEAKVAELEPSSGKESTNAKGRKEEVPI
tara:strand:+ start:520 stop:744 length:225 start_codon:yes stop_codon:yes gene_type:complete